MEKLAPLPPRRGASGPPGSARSRSGFRLRDDRGGAVFVEFLIAFVPLFLFFTGLVQLSLLHAARIITQVAADRTARAASVVLADDKKFYNGEALNTAPSGDPVSGTSASIRFSSIRRAALLATRPLRSSGIDSLRGAFAGGGDDDSGNDPALSVECKGRPDCTYQRNELVTVRVKYEYTCIVPVGRIACGMDFKSELVAESSMPNFAADYEY